MHGQQNIEIWYKLYIYGFLFTTAKKFSRYVAGIYSTRSVAALHTKVAVLWYKDCCMVRTAISQQETPAGSALLILQKGFQKFQLRRVVQSKKAAHTLYFLPQMHVNLPRHFGAYSCRLEMTAWQFANCVYVGSPQQVGLCCSVSATKCVTCMFSDAAAFVRGTVHNHTPVRTRLQTVTAVHVCCRLVPGIACSLCRSVTL